jgi:hypothetical protein
MRGAKIAGYRRRRRVKTTTPDRATQKVPDLLNRDFTAEQPNSRYVGDINLLAVGDRLESVSGHGDRLLLRPVRWLGDRLRDSSDENAVLYW